MQQVVGRRQRHFAPQADIQCLFDLADNQDATDLGLLEERCQKGRFLVARHVLAPPPPSRRSAIPRRTSHADKACPQLAGPADRNPDGLRRLLQRQAKFQRQHDGLRLSQFLDRLGLCQSDFGDLK